VTASSSARRPMTRFWLYGALLPIRLSRVPMSSGAAHGTRSGRSRGDGPGPMAFVLDAFALVALALDEPAAPEVEMSLRRGDSKVSAVNLAEAIDQLGRVHGHGTDQLRAAFEPVLGEVLEVVDVDGTLGWRAAELRRRHYRRRASELSLADCIALATTGHGDTLATADAPLARAARAESVEILALPDATGRRP
jgi:PIN domain nuclease of toxin-antitoxin system